tara:strand:- start:608 stop:853 length:246 start_codon:yes stop_codon:yes gene_type:complete
LDAFKIIAWGVYFSDTAALFRLLHTIIEGLSGLQLGEFGGGSLKKTKELFPTATAIERALIEGVTFIATTGHVRELLGGLL